MKTKSKQKKFRTEQIESWYATGKMVLTTATKNSDLYRIPQIKVEISREHWNPNPVLSRHFDL